MNIIKKFILSKKIRSIKFFAMDCDGVLTDCKTIKNFFMRDGMGIITLMKKGIKTGIISGDSSPDIEQRAKKLGMNECFLGSKDKIKTLNKIMDKYCLTYNDIAYIGDDLQDIDVMKEVGLSIAVNDAAKEVKKVAHFITKAKGGNGAVREVCEIIWRSK